MSLVEHLTGCLEQSQSREKAALQRCSELETSAASRRNSESFPPVFSTSAGSLDSADSLDAKEHGETSASILHAINSK